MEMPWKLNVSPIWTWFSHIPMDSVVGALGGGRLPNIPRNALGRQIPNGAALNAAILAYNALPPCLPNGDTAGPVPCNEGQTLSQVNPKLKFGDDFNSFDMRITRTFHFTEPHALQVIAEVFNLFNVTNIRGTTNRNYSGFNNQIDSATFNRALDTAAEIFCSAGPPRLSF